MKEHFRKNRAVLAFTLAWFILNLLQAAFTEIMEDEAYYWLYSRFMDWGYFDHPPMVALLIRLGSGLFQGTLGVRLFHSLLGAGTIYILWHMIPERSRDARIFIWSILAVTLMHLHVAGFLALPDIPLVFFASLFFLLLRDYLNEDKAGLAILLGIVAAGMMYSKYHALLIFFFTLLPAWKLLLRRSFWLFVAVALVLYLPHILWQFKHDFVSFQYHLVDRADPFQPRQILEYLGNQILVTGPLAGFILLYLSFIRRANGIYERVLKYNLVGFFGFFLLSSLRGHVEPHWTAAAFPPMIVLALVNLGAHPRLRKPLRVLCMISIPMLLLLRAYLVWDFLPIPMHFSKMFHGKDAWAKDIEAVAGDRPVVFMNKFQNPSVYWFYTGKKAFTRNNILYRRNQFDVWPFESELEGDSVLLTRWGTRRDSMQVLTTVYGDIPYYILRYCSFNRLSIRILEKEIEAGAGKPFTVRVRISNPTPGVVDLDCDCDLPPLLMYTYRSRERKYSYFQVDPQPELGSLYPGDEVLLDLTIPAPEEPGEYRLSVSFGSAILLPGINGPPSELTVTPAGDYGLARR